MLKPSQNILHLRFRTVFEGMMIASVSSIIICAVAAVLIRNRPILAEMRSWISICILLMSSFLGARYSIKPSSENKMISATIIGAAFILLLMTINIMLLSWTIDDVLFKTLSILFGSAMATLGYRQKGRGNAAKRYRHKMLT